MDDHQFEHILSGMRSLYQQLSRQTDLLERLTLALESAQPAPNYLRDIKEYARFNWAEINATPAETDSDGVAVVIWRGHRFLRRAPQNKFDPAIWYSRAVGKDDSGENRYERLITFKEMGQSEPLPEKVRRVTQ